MLIANATTNTHSIAELNAMLDLEKWLKQKLVGKRGSVMASISHLDLKLVVSTTNACRILTLKHDADDSDRTVIKLAKPAKGTGAWTTQMCTLTWSS